MRLLSSLRLVWLLLPGLQTLYSQTPCSNGADGIPSDAIQAYLACALDFRNQHQLPEAIQRLQYLHQHHPEFLPAQLELAMTLAWAKRYAESLSIYEQVLQTDPTLNAARIGQAWVWAWKGDLARAESAFRTLIVEQPGWMDAQLGLAFTLRAGLHYEAARKLYEQILTQTPDHPEAKQGLALLQNAARTDVTIATGKLTVSDGREVVQQTLEMSHVLHEGLSVAGTAFFDRNPNVGGDQWGGGRVGFMKRPNTHWQYGVSVFGSRGNGAYRYGIGVEASHQITKSFTVLGTMRPGLNQGRKFEWVAGGGVLWQISRESYVLPQCFAEQLAGIPRAYTCVATAKLEVIPRFSVVPTVVWHEKETVPPERIWDANIGAMLRISRQVYAGLNWGVSDGDMFRMGFMLRVRK